MSEASSGTWWRVYLRWPSGKLETFRTQNPRSFTAMRSPVILAQIAEPEVHAVQLAFWRQVVRTDAAERRAA